jgi:hypothetical protein
VMDNKAASNTAHLLMPWKACSCIASGMLFANFDSCRAAYELIPSSKQQLKT